MPGETLFVDSFSTGVTVKAAAEPKETIDTKPAGIPVQALNTSEWKTGGTKYIKDKNTFRIAEADTLDVRESLPPGHYVVQENMFYMFLKETERPELPEKIYGGADSLKDRILHTFMERTSTTGVLLSGQKGSGKTMLSKAICVDACDIYKMPVILVTDTFKHDLNEFIKSIDQPVVILFDEFEKTYGQTQQEALLTLLDGFHASKKLFLLTSNEIKKINENMLNRPGRLYYNISFEGLSQEFIEEYCADKLIYPEHTDQLITVSTLFNAFSFDMLQALVEEVNRYNQKPFDLVHLLNTKPEISAEREYGIKRVEVGGQTLTALAYGHKYTVSLNVYTDNIYLELTAKVTGKEYIFVRDNLRKPDGEYITKKVLDWISEGNGEWAKEPPLSTDPDYEEYQKRFFETPPHLNEQLKDKSKKVRASAEEQIKKLRVEHNHKYNRMTLTLSTLLTPEHMVSVNKNEIVYRDPNGVKVILSRKEVKKPGNVSPL